MNKKDLQKGKTLNQIFKVKEIDSENFTMRFVMSTPEIDRHGEVIDQKGWDFGPFMLNPVVLWGHDQSLPAVGKVIAIENVNGNTEGVVKFAVNENPLAETLWNLYSEGFMSAVSVGFMNLEWMYNEMTDVITLLKNTLFELSLVNVPANASALAKAKAKGIDVSLLTPAKKVEEDKFKNLGTKVTKSEDEDEEEEEDSDEDEDEDSEEEDEEKEITAPIKTESDEEVKSALAVLMKTDKAVIKASVKELEKHLNDAGVAEEIPATKKGFSNKHINRLINSLLESKSKPEGAL